MGLPDQPRFHIHLLTNITITNESGVSTTGPVECGVIVIASTLSKEEGFEELGAARIGLGEDGEQFITYMQPNEERQPCQLEPSHGSCGGDVVMLPQVTTWAALPESDEL